MKFSGRFMQAAVDAGSALGRTRRTAINPATSRHLASTRRAPTTARSAAPQVPKKSGAIEAVLPSMKNTLSDYAEGPIVVHGSPIPNLKTIEPRLGSAALPDRSVAYGWKTSDVAGFDDADVLQGVTWSNLQNPRYTKPGSSIYITRAKPGSAVTDYDAPSSVYTSSEPMEVLAELSGDMIETEGRIDSMKMLAALKTNLEKLGVTHHVKKVAQSSAETSVV
jgi:hypothetical protein